MSDDAGLLAKQAEISAETRKFLNESLYAHALVGCWPRKGVPYPATSNTDTPDDAEAELQARNLMSEQRARAVNKLATYWDARMPRHSRKPACLHLVSEGATHPPVADFATLYTYEPKDAFVPRVSLAFARRDNAVTHGRLRPVIDQVNERYGELLAEKEDDLDITDRVNALHRRIEELTLGFFHPFEVNALANDAVGDSETQGSVALSDSSKRMRNAFGRCLSDFLTEAHHRICLKSQTTQCDP